MAVVMVFLRCVVLVRQLWSSRQTARLPYVAFFSQGWHSPILATVADQ
jgi:hypothetical protein